MKWNTPVIKHSKWRVCEDNLDTHTTHASTKPLYTYGNSFCNKVDLKFATGYEVLKVQKQIKLFITF